MIRLNGNGDQICKVFLAHGQTLLLFLTLTGSRTNAYGEIKDHGLTDKRPPASPSSKRHFNLSRLLPTNCFNPYDQCISPN